MRVPLDSYLQGHGKVFSLVVGVPFAPLDVDLSRLARGEWNASVDRFRLWYLPGEGNGGDACYLMVRKFDPTDGVLVWGHVVVNLARGAKDGCGFTVGLLSNDEVRARAMLGAMLEIPPSFHRRNELKVVERRWRSDSKAVLRFLANVHSSMMNSAPDSGGKAYTLRFEPPPGMMEELKRGMGAWW